jgi:hypothetical protein
MINLFRAIVVCVFLIAADQAYAQNVVNVSNVTTVQTTPYIQVMVHQVPYYVVAVPVVVNPLVVEHRVIWGYPYVPVTIPVNQYNYWGYSRQCLLINKY